MQAIFTIGHSNHPIAHFIGLLKQHGVTAVCDLRSQPYSRLHPQFRRDLLRDSLRAEGIAYVFLGAELGARSNDPACHRQGRVDYDLLAATETFRRGLERVAEGAKTYRLALMCAEKDPLRCHRTILVSRRLVERGMEVRHILADGRVEPHAEAIERLLAILRMPPPDMLRSREEIIADAYRIQGEAIAHEAKHGTGTTMAGTAGRADRRR